MTHETCTITKTEHTERHECPPCPHGLIRGFDLPLTGDQLVDDTGRRLKVHRIDSLTCGSREHRRAIGATRG